MLAFTRSVGLVGLDAFQVNVEVDLTNGLPSFTIVGLPDNAVKESRERVQSAIGNTGFTLPPKKLTVNLAPAGKKKEGAAFDLPIAVGSWRPRGTFPGKGQGSTHTWPNLPSTAL